MLKPAEVITVWQTEQGSLLVFLARFSGFSKEAFLDNHLKNLNGMTTFSQENF